mgnify:CR=1 FL=1
MRIHFFTAPFGWSGRQREGWGLPSGVIAASHAPLLLLSVKFYSVGKFSKNNKRGKPPLSGTVIISVRKNKTKKGPSSWTL